MIFYPSMTGTLNNDAIPPCRNCPILYPDARSISPFSS